MKLVTKKPITVSVMRHAGSHLILPIVGELAHKAVNAPKGEASLIAKPADKVIVFLRDPRNWMVSVFKWKHREASIQAPGGEAGFMDDRLADFMIVPGKKKSMSYMLFVQIWAERWVGWPDALTLTFEELQDPVTAIPAVARIKDFLGDLCYPPDVDPAAAYTAVFGKSQTYTGRTSKWRDWFGPATQAAWAANGGQTLLEKMGYD